jgi:ornithine--oxo-acid transaminase
MNTWIRANFGERAGGLPPGMIPEAKAGEHPRSSDRAAVARTALKVLVEEGMIENAAVMGEYFSEQLAEMPQKNIREIRSRGLLIGVEMKTEAGPARGYCEGLQKKGILAKETHDTTIRFAPPLIIDKAVIDWAMPMIRDVLAK